MSLYLIQTSKDVSDFYRLIIKYQVYQWEKPYNIITYRMSVILDMVAHLIDNPGNRNVNMLHGQLKHNMTTFVKSMEHAVSPEYRRKLWLDMQ